MTLDMFWSRTKLNLITGCVEWQGAKNNQGYGHVGMIHNHWRRMVSAHRIAAYLTWGFDLNSKLHILHSCDNPSCVNPSHLSQGTNKDNIRDKQSKRLGKRLARHSNI